MEITKELTRMAQEACAYLGADITDVYTSRTRRLPESKVKCLIMKYLKEEKGYLLKESAAVCELKNHTTVINALMRAEQHLENDEVLRIIYYRSLSHFEFKIPDKLTPITTCNGKIPKKVSQYTIKGKCLKVWDTIAAAAIGMSVSKSSIMVAARSKRSLCKGFKWEYER